LKFPFQCIFHLCISNLLPPLSLLLLLLEPGSGFRDFCILKASKEREIPAEVKLSEVPEVSLSHRFYFSTKNENGSEWEGKETVYHSLVYLLRVGEGR
jgi:hypothetical protein